MLQLGGLHLHWAGRLDKVPPMVKTPSLCRINGESMELYPTGVGEGMKICNIVVAYMLDGVPVRSYFREGQAAFLRVATEMIWLLSMLSCQPHKSK